MLRGCCLSKNAFGWTGNVILLYRFHCFVVVITIFFVCFAADEESLDNFKKEYYAQMDHSQKNKKKFNLAAVKAQKEVRHKLRAAKWREEVEEALRKGRSLVISEPLIVQDHPRELQPTPTSIPSVEVAENEVEVLCVSPLRVNSPAPMGEVSDRRMIIVPQSVSPQPEMPRPVKRRKVILDEDDSSLGAPAPSEGLGEGGLSSGSVKDEADVRKGLLGIPVSDRSGFVLNALQAYRLVDSLVLDHLRLTDSSRELSSLREALRLAQA